MIMLPEIEIGETSGGEKGFIYLLHFNAPICHARHYVGFTSDIDKRMIRHRAGRGSKLIAAAVQHRITFEVVRIWSGDRHFERKLKNHKNGPRLCPICNTAH